MGPSQEDEERALIALYGPKEDWPHDSRGPGIAASVWVAFSFAAIFVALRFWTRIKIVRSLGAADWLILASLVRPLSEIITLKRSSNSLLARSCRHVGRDDSGSWLWNGETRI